MSRLINMITAAIGQRAAMRRAELRARARRLVTEDRAARRA